MVSCLDTLGTLVAGAVLLAFALASLFRFGSRIGEWFSSLETENRKLYWAAIGLVCWTVIIGAVASAVSLLVRVVYIAEQLDNPTDWAAAASISLLMGSLAVAILAGIPWLVLVSLVRVVRAHRWRARILEVREGREHSQ